LTAAEELTLFETSWTREESRCCGNRNSCPDSQTARDGFDFVLLPPLSFYIARSDTRCSCRGSAIIAPVCRRRASGRKRVNLSLMAKVIAGQAHRGNLLADEFLYPADMLASLRREGVLVLGTLDRHSDAGCNGSQRQPILAQLKDLPDRYLLPDII
jgi:hypothetical protein